MKMKELNLRELQECCLDILKDVDTFCRTKGINYSIAYGSLLGAVRHKGFIPWDDDIDIVMPRKDYERFCHEYVSKDYKVVFKGNTPDCFIPYARVTDFVRTESRTYSPWMNDIQNPGVWIDIFPLDYAPDNESENRLLYKLSTVIIEYNNKLRKTMMVSLKGSPFYFRIKHLFHGNSTHAHLRSKHPEELAGGFDLILRKYVSSPTRHLSQYCCPDTNIVEWFDSSLFENTSEYEFEGCHFKGPADSDSVLKAWFGDYMELPPESKRKCKSRRYLRFYWKDSLR